MSIRLVQVDLLDIDRHGARLDLRQVEDIADQVQQVGAGAVDGPGELDLLRGQIAVRVFAQLLTEDQDAVQRRAQLVRHVGEELGFVFRGQRQLGGLLLERAAGLLDFLVLRLDLDIALGKLLRLLFELLVGLLQFALLRLQFGGELLRLLQQSFRLHRRLDAVEDDADARGQLIEERGLQVGKAAERGQLDHRLDLAFEQHRQHDQIVRLRLEQAGGDRHDTVRDLRDQHASRIARALPDQTLARAQPLRMARRSRCRHRPKAAASRLRVRRDR